MVGLLDELEQRNLLADCTAREELGAKLASECVRVYAGFDPTATSLHLGNLVPITGLLRMQRAGHKPYPLVGGATGMIGDPSGKSQERELLGADALDHNVALIEKQLRRFLDFDDPKTGAVMVNNNDWFAPITFLDFLRDVGKHLTVNYMMAKESVRTRLEDRDQGISYTEFSYMLLQAYDFVVLARQHDCLVQLGATDQWGNITAGIELGRKLDSKQLYGLVHPLLLDSKGQKMGKTASGTKLWLDAELTSPYAFYQYFLNVEDSEVAKLLRMFSPKPLTEIAELVAAHEQAPNKREAQRTLAVDMVTYVHGQEATRRAIAASGVMFGGALDDVDDATLEPLLADVPNSELPRTELEQGVSLLDLLARTGLAKSKGAARRLVSGGGIYLNNQRVSDDRLVTRDDLGTETMMILRSGKKNYHIVRSP